MYDVHPIRRMFLVLLIVCLTAGVAIAQVQVGDNTSLSLSGSVGFGYSGGFEATGISNHGLSFTGNSNLTGYYYNPSFVSFNVQPFYNRSQSNSESQFITNDSGVNASLHLFSGSRFPGSISYDKNLNSTGQFGLPGATNFTTDGSTTGVTIAWSALLPKLPTLQATYSTTDSSASVLGESGRFNSKNKNLNLYSTYSLAGFQLNSFFTHQTQDASFPSFLGIGASQSDGSSNSYGFTASHALPLSGNVAGTWSRSNYGYEGAAYSNDGTTDSATATVSFNPIRKFYIMSGVRYTSNLLGALQQAGVVAGNTGFYGDESHAVSFDTSATYTIVRGISVQGYVNHRLEYYSGRDFNDTQYGGTFNFNYAKPLLGLLYFSVGMVDTASEEGNRGMGFIGSVGMKRKFNGWDVAADYSYSQNVQTLIALYTTSAYSYGSSVQRRIGSNTYWSGSFRGMHSGITQEDGSSNHSETISNGFRWRRYSFSGNYSQSHGTSVLTSNGALTSTSTAGLITNDFVFFNGRSFGVGVGLSPFRKMTVTANYSRVKSDTLSHALYSFNQGSQFNTRLEYRLRKLWLSGNFTRLQQEIGATGGAPRVVNSYYFGISRWFNVF